MGKRQVVRRVGPKEDEGLVIRGEDIMEELQQEAVSRAQRESEVEALEASSTDSEQVGESMPQQPCTVGALQAAVSGGVLGAVFGLGGALLTPKAGLNWKRLSGAAGSSAKDFALWGGVYSLVSCLLQRIRLTEDAINSGVAGAVTGFAISLKGGWRGALQSAALIGALSFAADHFGKQSAQAATLTSGPQLVEIDPTYSCSARVDKKGVHCSICRLCGRKEEKRRAVAKESQ